MTLVPTTYPSRHPFRDKRIPEGKHKILVVGGTRTFTDWDLLNRTLDRVTFFMDLVTVATGGYEGADGLGVRWANRWWWPYRVYEARWYAGGKAAGPIRNRKMLEESGPNAFLVAFWDGKSPGTKDLLTQAKALLKPNRIKVVRYAGASGV